MILKQTAAFTVGLILTGCASTLNYFSSPQWVLEDHPLVEKIWQVKEGKYVDKQQLLNSIVSGEYVLLGETHDNPLHHKYQAWAIQQLSKQGREMAVAFEMITPNKTQALIQPGLTTAENVFDAVEWEKSGWPSREIYKPVVEATLQAGYQIFPANIDKQDLRQIIMQGEDAIPQSIKVQLDNNPLSEDYEAILRKGIEESHCQMLPAEMVPSMMRGQRVRDVAIAQSLVENKHKDGIVLIAGSGHAQYRGVPIYIQSQDASAKIISLAWMEVDERLSTPQEYSKYWSSDDLPFDYVWFTARIDRPDPCEELKKHHKFSKKEE